MSAMINNLEDQYENRPPLHLINTATWFETEPPEPDQILENFVDRGDKLVTIGRSKNYKSFFEFQMAICIAAGKDFLIWKVSKPRRVLLVQFEVQEKHYHKRFKKLTRALGITAADIGDRLNVICARGCGITGDAGVKRVQEACDEFKPDMIIFDPLYKISTGAENNAEDMKVILNSFDELAVKTGAAVAYVHHDPKGRPGDKDTQDRGAGSNVLGRDYDAAITMTEHADGNNAVVIEMLGRNYIQQESFTILWTVDENDFSYCFELAPDMMPNKKTTQTKNKKPDYPFYLPVAFSILEKAEETDCKEFKDEFKLKTGESRNYTQEFLNWATAGPNSHIISREERGPGKHRKWLKIGKRPQLNS